jgi:hypothetical protein
VSNERTIREERFAKYVRLFYFTGIRMWENDCGSRFPGSRLEPQTSRLRSRNINIWQRRYVDGRNFFGAVIFWTCRPITEENIDIVKLTPRNRIFLKNLTVRSAIEENPSLKWNPKVHCSDRKTRHWLSLCWGRWNQSTAFIPHPF